MEVNGIEDNRITVRELFDKALLFVPKPDTTLSLQEIKEGGGIQAVGGVYTFYNRHKEPLYVGISSNVKKRVSAHLHEGSGNGDLFRYITAGYGVTVSVIYEDNKAFQEVYESYLIHTLEPRYNVAKTGRKRFNSL